MFSRFPPPPSPLLNGRFNSPRPFPISPTPLLTTTTRPPSQPIASKETIRHPTRMISSSVEDMFQIVVNQYHEEEAELESYMKHVKACNRGSEKRSEFMPFIVENYVVGFIHLRFLKHLRRFPSVFMTGRRDRTYQGTNHATRRVDTEDSVTLHRSLTTKEKMTEAVGGVLKILNEEGVIPGWRHELIPVVEAFGMPPLLCIERSAAPFFGIKVYGVHMNGYVLNANKEKFLWVAKRSETKSNFPGMLDHLVAGGQPEGLSCKENLIKECDEEANISRSLAEKAVAVGAVSYDDIDEDKFKRDVLFCYDLELPPDFEPRNKDGEVESFHLVPMGQVSKILRTTRLYKPNCALVVIDFLFRHGYFTPEQNGYLQLLQSLRMGDCS